LFGYVAYFLHRCTIGSKLVRDQDQERSVAAHLFPEEFHGGLAIASLRDEAFEHFPFMIHSPPKIVHLAVDLHEHPIQMPEPLVAFRIACTRLPPISTANSGPNRVHQNRTVSWLMSMPRSCDLSP
jgi:hypothetical protein